MKFKTGLLRQQGRLLEHALLTATKPREFSSGKTLSQPDIKSRSTSRRPSAGHSASSGQDGILVLEGAVQHEGVVVPNNRMYPYIYLCAIQFITCIHIYIYTHISPSLSLPLLLQLCQFLGRTTHSCFGAARRLRLHVEHARAGS